MKLENGKFYKLSFDYDIYIVKCIDAENLDFKPLKLYSRYLDKYWDADLYTSENFLIMQLLKTKDEKCELKEFDKLEHLI